MKKITLIYFLLIFSFLYVHAQENPKSNDLDKEYTPPPTSIFNNESKDNNSYHRNSDVTQSKNIVTISLFSLPRGFTEFSYERAINQRFSVSAGYGFYFMRDYISDLLGDFGNDLWDIGSNSSELSLYTIRSSSDFVSKNSYHYAFGLKLFFNKDDFDTRYFIELNTRICKLHYKWKLNTDEYDKKFMIGLPDTYLDSKIFSVNWGWQWNSGNEKMKFSNELTMGFGIRNNKFYSYSSRNLETNYGNNGANESYYFKNNNKTNEVKLSISLGYKLGIGW